MEGMTIMLQEVVRKLEILDSKHEGIDSRLVLVEGNSQGRATREDESGDDLEPTCRKVVRGTNWSEERVTRQTKVEFPSFDGNRVQEWLFKCERFFELDDTPADMKVSIASVYLSGLAMEWHYAFVKNRKLLGPISWVEYADAMTTRFGSVEMKRPIAQLKRLREEGSLFTYIDSFVALVSQVELSDEDQVAMFIEGLRGDNKKLITVLTPSNLQHAIAFAKALTTEEDPYRGRSRVNDQAITMAKPVAWTGAKQISGGSGAKPWQGANRGIITGKTPLGVERKSAVYQPPHRRFTSAEIDEKRAKGLCFWCDERFTFGHKCANRKLYSMALEPAEEEEVVEEPDSQETDEQENATLSLHALHGVELTGSNRTMKLVGYFKKKKLNILVDSGSTHNFLDHAVAKQVGCVSQRIVAQKVMVANGDRVNCNAMIREFSWAMHGTKFKAKVLLMQLCGCELILGMEWLNALGVVKWDFPNRTMEFQWEGQSVKLTAETEQKNIWREGSVSRLDNVLGLMMLQEEAEKQPNGWAIDQLSGPEGVKAILRQFSGVFEEPKSLPPHRRQDHSIPLEDGVKGLSLRPYRYSSMQKDVIERLVDEMLQTGIIQQSTSPFSSPVVLVKKKDGTWRMCVDYRELNLKTIKDKFPIPVIEELLDELGGSCWFSKLDLRSGYHQIRVNPSDITKTAFRTHEGHYEFLVMPFGLTNAPATFQSLMNEVFRPYLRRFVLVFFDDILVYSKSLPEHETHLKLVLKVLQENVLFAKYNKCCFASRKVEYLGHFITEEGVSTDPRKVEAVKNWPIPKTLKQLRGFLGLTGYYRRFVQGYGTISKPFTSLLKKDAFKWGEQAQIAFEELKVAMISAPTLALPDFTREFVLETDACDVGIGAVLMQEGHPIAYISKALARRHLGLSVYDKELLSIVFAVEKWRHYLLERHFTIKTDHQSLKFLLEQRLHNDSQFRWLSKLIGFDYEISYKKGKENVVADALSRVQGVELLSIALTIEQGTLLDDIKGSWDRDLQMKSEIEKLEAGQPSYFTWKQGLLLKNGKLVVGRGEELRQNIIRIFHSSPASGHSGIHATTKRIASYCYWKGLEKDVRLFIQSCDICQRCKYDNSVYPGLLQPLPIPTAVWSEVSMDFISGLPKSYGREVIMVVVDRLTKYSHFMGLYHPFNASTVAEVFLNHVYKLHGMPTTIVSDRDAIFLSSFWQSFFKLQGVALHLSTAYHPQTDGQTEVVNRCLETYLRCMTSDCPTKWFRWLSLAEWWYNTTFHSSIQMTPFEALYGYSPPIHVPYIRGTAVSQDVERELVDRDAMLQLLRFHLHRAQHRMVQLANKKRSERVFQIGDWVYVKLQPYKQMSVEGRSNNKLSSLYFGPYQILDKVGEVAYRLQLPEGSQIHPTFHVSKLKKSLNTGQVASTTLPVTGAKLKLPDCILDRKMVKRGNRAATKVLVQWQGGGPDTATWEFLFDLQAKYPNCILEDKDIVEGGVLMRENAGQERRFVGGEAEEHEGGAEEYEAGILPPELQYAEKNYGSGYNRL